MASVVRLPDDVVEQLQTLAALDGRTQADWMRDAIYVLIDGLRVSGELDRLEQVHTERQEIVRRQVDQVRALTPAPGGVAARLQSKKTARKR